MEKRDKTFIWISWLTKLLAGEVQCEFACWFKAHYKYDKLPSDFNLVRWTMEHNQLVHKTRDELEKQGYKVFIEDQNSLKAEISGALVSAKPDIVALKDDERLVVDCKTGRPKNSDTVQVMLYMMLLEETHKAKANWEGRVGYKNNSVPIPSPAVTQSFMNVVNTIVAKLGSNDPARKIPSENECKRCDIPEGDCPERIESDGRPY